MAMHLPPLQQSHRHMLPPEAALRWIPSLAIRVLSILVIVCLLPIAKGGEPEQATPSRRALPEEPKLLQLSTAVLSDEDRARISGHTGNLWVKGLETLSEDDARAIASVRGPLSIQVPSLSLACAHELAKHRGGMILSKLATLSDEAAEALAQHRGSLDLFGCHTLSAAAMQHLVNGRATELGLDITNIDVEAARALAHFKGNVEFFNLSSLDSESAEAISSLPGDLRLKLFELTPPVAKALTRKKGKLTLRLGDREKSLKLGVETAKALSQFAEGDIRLENVTFERIPSSVLEAFAGYKGHLSVTWRDPLTDEAAQALGCSKGSLIVSLPNGSPTAPVHWLASHPGDLVIFGLRDCPLDVAKALAEHRGGKLTLNGMQRMSESVAAALSQHAGPLELSFQIDFSDTNRRGFDNEPPSDVVNMLCRHRGTLRIPASWVRPDTIDSLLTHIGGLSVWAPHVFTFSLFEPPTSTKSTWEWMPLDLFERLATYAGPLRLDGELTDEMAQALTKHRSDLLIDLPQRESVAKSLLSREGRLFLTTYSNRTTVASATIVASEKNRTPVCNTPYLIGSDAVEIASIFVQRKGPLSLPRLQYVKGEALRILATKGDIRLPPLDRLYILSNDGRDVLPGEVVSAEFLRKNAEKQPPPEMPEWHSWDKLLSEHE